MPMRNLLGPTCRFKVILNHDIIVILQALVSEHQYGTMYLHELTNMVHHTGLVHVWSYSFE